MGLKIRNTIFISENESHRLVAIEIDPRDTTIEC